MYARRLNKIMESSSPRRSKFAVAAVVVACSPRLLRLLAHTFCAVINLSYAAQFKLAFWVSLISVAAEPIAVGMKLSIAAFKEVATMMATSENVSSD